MIFNEIIETGLCEKNIKTFHREAVRAVIIRGNTILMIYTNKGDYKFPGGGIEDGETHQDAVIREVLEETGYVAEGANELIGIMVERRPEKTDRDSVFEMTSYYYLSNVSDRQVNQKLDEYEAELEFKPTWISIEEAILENQRVLNNNQTQNINIWVERELFALEKLKSFVRGE